MSKWHAETVSETPPHYGVCEEGSNQPRALVWTAEDARTMAAVPALIAALERSDRLVKYMMKHVGQMSGYDGFFADLNEHCIAVGNFRRDGLLAQANGEG